MLSGDAVDNYKGCPSIGKVKAAAIVDAVIDEPEETIWKTIVETYESKGLTGEDALTQARVARILRHTELRPGKEGTDPVDADKEMTWTYSTTICNTASSPC